MCQVFKSACLFCWCTAAKSKIDAVRFKIIPGDWGKAGSGWLIWLLTNRSASSGEAEFTSSSGMFAHAKCE